MSRGWAVLVIWKTSTKEFLVNNLGRPAIFMTKKRAEEERDRLRKGIACQARSVSVVAVP